MERGERRLRRWWLGVCRARREQATQRDAALPPGCCYPAGPRRHAAADGRQAGRCSGAFHPRGAAGVGNMVFVAPTSRAQCLTACAAIQLCPQRSCVLASHWVLIELPSTSPTQIHTVRRLFEDGRDDPPLTRNQPPVAGAIRWCRSLLGRVRRTWLRLQGLGRKLEELDAGRRAAAAMTGEQAGPGVGAGAVMPLCSLLLQQSSTSGLCKAWLPHLHPAAQPCTSVSHVCPNPPCRTGAGRAAVREGPLCRGGHFQCVAYLAPLCVRHANTLPRLAV